MDENIIQSILEIDKSASEKLAEAEKQRNLIIAGAKEQQEKIIESRIKAADATLKEIEEKEKAEADKKLEAINAAGEKEIERLKDVYENRHGSWEEDIFHAIVNG